jgi:uncharacterized DUF497 family protein
MYIMPRLKTTQPVKFIWDIHNREKNWLKHKVDYKECEEIFFNQPLSIFPDVKHSTKESRLVALGLTNEDRKLTIIFTYRNKKIRIISARNMSRKERKQYGKS